MNLHECDFPGCGKSFPKLWRLKEHQCSAHTGERPHVCTHPGCDKAFIRSYHLKRHMISHLSGDEKPTFMCSHPGCGKVYTLKQNLRKHEKGHKLPLPYKCPREGCCAAFRKHSQLTVHKTNQHGEEKKLLKCEHQGCTKTFSWPKHLKRHKKIHEGYKCSLEGCEVVCSSWSELRKHSSTHSKVCLECGKTFTRARQLRLHSAVHATTRRVLICKWKGCGRTYTTLYNLQQHIGSFHCRKKPHACTHEGCRATFSTKQACVRHQKSEHSNHPKPKRKRKKKRSLASHLSGYNLTKSNPTSSQPPAALPASTQTPVSLSATEPSTAESTCPAESLDSAANDYADEGAAQIINNVNNSVLLKINSDTVKCRGMSCVQLKSLKFLIPVVPRITIT